MCLGSHARQSASKEGFGECTVHQRTEDNMPELGEHGLESVRAGLIGDISPWSCHRKSPGKPPGADARASPSVSGPQAGEGFSSSTGPAITRGVTDPVRRAVLRTDPGVILMHPCRALGTDPLDQHRRRHPRVLPQHRMDCRFRGVDSGVLQCTHACGQSALTAFATGGTG
jgi:hypothetical protein